MIRAVLDTNVYISALNYGGIPFEILRKAGIHIFGDYVITYTGLHLGKLDDNIVFFVIRSQNLAESYRKWFWYMWGKAGTK